MGAERETLGDREIERKIKREREREGGGGMQNN